MGEQFSAHVEQHGNATGCGIYSTEECEAFGVGCLGQRNHVCFGPFALVGADRLIDQLPVGAKLVKEQLKEDNLVLGRQRVVAKHEQLGQRSTRGFAS